MSNPNVTADTVGLDQGRAAAHERVGDALIGEVVLVKKDALDRGIAKF